MKAKDVSLWVKILAIAVLIVGLALKGLGIMAGVTVWDIIMVSFACELVFLGVSVNIILDKIFGKRE